MNRHLRLGEGGEEMAAQHLRNAGLRIVDRRVRCRHGELDIVARDGREWVFVEVKTRSQTRFGSAAESLTPTKIRRMRSAVEEYVHAHHLENEPIRCDLVAIDLVEGESASIVHYPGGIVF